MCRRALRGRASVASGRNNVDDEEDDNEADVDAVTGGL